MTAERECYVYVVLPGETVFTTAGRFRVEQIDGVATGRFVYRRAYRERTDAVELDPAELRLAAGTFETVRLGGFFGAVRDAMPDYWGRLVIERAAGATVLDEFDYLLRGPDDRAGALGFGLNVEPPPVRPHFNSVLQLDVLQQRAEALLAGEIVDSPPLLERLLMLGTSMGGARPKAVVADSARSYLAKFPHPDDRWNHPRVEHGVLTLARACGINVAEHRCSAVGHREALLLNRFDRRKTAAGYQRARMVSALTLLCADDSATERGNWSYLLLADEIRRSSGVPRDDLRELFTRMCFNAVVSNLDDHPRNHAVIAWQRQWRLSPAYDLVPSPVVAQQRRDLAMICGRFGRWANRENLLSGAGRFLLSPSEAAATFDHVRTTVNSRWRELLRQAGASKADCDAVASAFDYAGLMQPAIQRSGATPTEI